MSDVINFFITSQIIIMLCLLACGTLLTFYFIIIKHTKKTWQRVDLYWILTGGFVAVSAISLSFYQDKTQSAQRNIDLAFSEVISFQQIAKSLAAQNCPELLTNRIFSETNPWRNDLHIVCINLKIISNIAINNPKLFNFSKQLAELPDISLNNLPNAVEFSKLELSSFSKLGSDTANTKNLDLGFLMWTNIFNDLYTPKNVKHSLSQLERSGFYNQLVYGYEGIEDKHKKIIENFKQLQQAWEQTVNRNYIYAIRSFFLSLFAFFFPLRIGKSYFELKHNIQQT
jgi:hypothetical protein